MMMARLPEQCKNHMTQEVYSTEPHDALNYMRSPKWDGLDILDSASTDSQSNGSDISVEGIYISIAAYSSPCCWCNRY